METVGPEEYARLLKRAKELWPKIDIRDTTSAEMHQGTIVVSEPGQDRQYLHTAEHFREWFDAKKKEKQKKRK